MIESELVYVKKRLLLFLILYFSFVFCVHASSGALKKNSIKTCPNGVTYGYHSKDKHWHVAERSNSSSGWSAVGDAFYYDPCPSDTSSISSTQVPSPPKNEDSYQEVQPSSESEEAPKEVSPSIDETLPEISDEESLKETIPALPKEDENYDIKDTSDSSILEEKNHVEVQESSSELETMTSPEITIENSAISDFEKSASENEIESEVEYSDDNSKSIPGVILLLPAYIGYRIYKKKK